MSCEKHLGLACLCENSAATQVIDRLQRELAEAKQEVDRLSAGLNSTTLRRETNIKDLERVTAERDAWQERAQRASDDHVAAMFAASRAMQERDDLKARLDQLHSAGHKVEFHRVPCHWQCANPHHTNYLHNEWRLYQEPPQPTVLQPGTVGYAKFKAADALADCVERHLSGVFGTIQPLEAALKAYRGEGEMK